MPLEKDHTLPPHSRTTIWADYEDIPAGSGQRPLAGAEFGATFTSQGDVGFIAERAMYVSRPGVTFLGGHASAGATAPSARWFFAEGATTWTFDEFLLLANPAAAPTRVRLTYMLPDGRTFVRDVTVGAQARVNVWVNYESFDGGATFPLADVSHSTVVESLDGTGIIAERSMWWQSAAWPGAGWNEGHNTFGANETGAAWMSALVRPYDLTYLLVANPNDASVAVRLTLGGTGATMASDRSWVYELLPQSRLTIPLHALDVTVAGPVSAAWVEVLGENPPGIFVEQATYDATFQAGSCRLLTRIRE